MVSISSKQQLLTQLMDGLLVFSLEDNTVPAPIPVDKIKSACGIDVGLEKFLTTSDAKAVAVPQFYRKAQARLARQQHKLLERRKGLITTKSSK